MKFIIGKEFSKKLYVVRILGEETEHEESISISLVIATTENAAMDRCRYLAMDSSLKFLSVEEYPYKTIYLNNCIPPIQSVRKLLELLPCDGIGYSEDSEGNNYRCNRDDTYSISPPYYAEKL